MMIILTYTGLPFQLYGVSEAIHAWSHLYFIGHIMIAFGFIIVLIIPTKKESQKEGGKSKEENRTEENGSEEESKEENRTEENGSEEESKEESGSEEESKKESGSEEEYKEESRSGESVSEEHNECKEEVKGQSEAPMLAKSLRKSKRHLRNSN